MSDGMNSGNNTEIERKFKIEYPDDAELAAMLSVPGAKSVSITQIYLVSPTEESDRIRRSESGGIVRYRRTIKRGDGIVREEYENDITAEEYLRLVAESADVSLSPIKKTRVRMPTGNRILEIDLYDGFTDYAVAEVELESPDEDLPDMSAVRIIREVTGDPEWLNVSIAGHGMPEK